MEKTLLTVSGLAKSFGRDEAAVSVLANLTFDLPAGGSLALMGRSGSGKSTLLNMLCGLEPPDAGELTLFGQDHRHADWQRLRRGRIGVVFQEANLMPTLSLLDNVRLRASLAGQPEAHCQHWLDVLDIGDLAHRFPDQVSGGQRQRAALAMVFAMSPDLILADEPTGSLDRVTADEVADSLFRLQADTGCALILATHDAELASRCQSTLDLAHRTTAQDAAVSKP
ncbi:MAG: ABC-type antimicrobial peptide transport system, ATPase component [Marinobacter excellens HL-55]|uniref:ABC-type antimicrobial peptide transport system, ATPase component n=1 Tax=Marinobacter excellens HL-55 TaxID=1305731 RepID=A0A0P7ZE52_9GAMM|nr:MAG: ABC-type antimicrobial peptide transport system, ATPase component [Marinobacter excellens HL-55]